MARGINVQEKVEKVSKPGFENSLIQLSKFLIKLIITVIRAKISGKLIQIAEADPQKSIFPAFLDETK